MLFLFSQFKRSPPKVPYKAIALATGLFLIGTILIIIGSLLLAGYFEVNDVSITRFKFFFHDLAFLRSCHCYLSVEV